jgi:sarcosine oxidase subunit alpha
MTTPVHSQGWVTSSCTSPTLKRPIALAMIEDGLSRIGETITLVSDAGERAARIAPRCAFDPEGQRLHG